MRIATLATSLWIPCVLAGQSVSVSPATMETDARSVRNAPVQRTISPLERTITLDLPDTTLGVALDVVRRQGGFRLMYRDAVVPVKRKRSALKGEMTVLTALTHLLDGTGIKVESAASNGVFLVQRKDSNSQSPETMGSIAGIVTDSGSGDGIAGATVTVVGTTIAATTGSKGDFVLPEVPVGERTLTFKLIGYASASRIVQVERQKRVTVRVVLKQTASLLSGVVTTATGPQRRLEVSSDVTRLNVDSIMTVAPIKSVTDLLATRVPGLQVLRTSGTPGDPARLRLRGVSSVNSSSNPIVIVDGVRVYAPDGNENAASSRVLTEHSTNIPHMMPTSQYAAPSPLDQIDPNLIETIEVFKGPSASSLYGSDAANGVIVITTKRGRPGKTRINASINTGTSSIPGRYPENRFLFGRQFNGRSVLCAFDVGCEIDSVVTLQAMNDARYRPLGRAGTSGASTTISGGTQTITYSFTGSGSATQGVAKLPGIVTELYRARLGTAPPSWMRRPDQYQTVSGGNSVEIEVTPSMQLRIANTVSSSEQQRSSLGTMAAGQLLHKYVSPERIALLGASAFLGHFQERVRVSTLQSQHHMALRWRVLPSIPLNVTAGLNPVSETGTTYIPADLPKFVVGSSDSSGAYSVGQRTSRSSSVAGNIMIPAGVSNGIRFPLVIGGDWREQRATTQRLEAEEFPKGVTEPTAFSTGGRSLTSVATYGVFVEPRISIGSRLFVQTGVRFDGGTASGDRAGLTNYPKLGLSWIALDDNGTNDHALGWVGFVAQQISQLRFRATFGNAGVQPLPTQHSRLWQTLMGTPDGGQTLQSAWVPMTLGNSRLRPERAMEFEGGAEIGLFNQRVSINTTMYRKHQRDAIMQIDVAGSVGASGIATQAVNIGDILNVGYDIQANAQVLETRPLRWNIAVDFSQRRNRLTRMDGNSNLSTGLAGQSRLAVGYPVYGYWAHPLAGYADRNGDGIMQRGEFVLADSAVYRGTAEPRYLMSMRSAVGLLDGRVQFDASVEYQHAMTQHNVLARYALDAAAAAPGATFLDQAVAIVSGESPYYLLQTVNVLRFHSFSATYTLPQSFTRALRVQHGTLSLQGSNLGVRTGYRGMDPNVNAYASGNLSGDYGQIPPPREWTLRINLIR